MLDANTLSQLSQLKTDLRAQRNINTGTVRGTQGRFGFVTLEDGREAFLAPDAMDRVFPGDTVEVAVQADDKGKLTAELETLVHSPIKNLVGQYVVRGKGHFIAVDLPQFSRWIFLPPKARSGAKEHDFLEARITQHPFKDGKAQAKVTAILGQPDTAGVEHQVTVRKHQLKTSWSEAQIKQRDSLLQTPDTSGAARADLTAVPFVTIDADTTRDMDDALYCEAMDNGWRLQVAIADPLAGIGLDSPLGKGAFIRGNTAYLPGEALTMIPDELAHQTYSLVAGEERPAWVFTIDIARDGAVNDFSYERAAIRSRHKLSYAAVAQYLTGEATDGVPAEVQELLNTFDALAEARNTYRGQHMLLMPEQDDFELILNEQRRIERIERTPQNRGHRIVEEAMLATNACAGELFARHPGYGIFSTHNGFREERHNDIRNVLKADLPEVGDADFTTLEGYRSLISTLQQSPEAEPLLSALRKMLQPGKLSTEARPHMGLGMSHYATVTSPIRRYNDLHNHAALAAIADNRTLTPTGEEQLATLQLQIAKTRQAARDLEQWLICLYMESKVGEQFEGRIVRINNRGITVELIDTGITGLVQVGEKGDNPSIDHQRMIMKNGDTVYRLNQPLMVKLAAVNQQRRQLQFVLGEAG